MNHDPARLDAILAEATTTSVRVECRDLDSARRMRYALARRRRGRGRVVIRLEGRVIVVEPTRDPVISVTSE